MIIPQIQELTKHLAKRYLAARVYMIFMTFLRFVPANPGAAAKRAIEYALHNMQGANVFNRLEPILDCAFPICQIFRGRLIGFCYGAEDIEEYYLPAFKWGGGAPTFVLSAIDQSATGLENRDSEILFMRANVNTL